MSSTKGMRESIALMIKCMGISWKNVVNHHLLITLCEYHILTTNICYLTNICVSPMAYFISNFLKRCLYEPFCRTTTPGNARHHYPYRWASPDDIQLLMQNSLWGQGEMISWEKNFQKLASKNMEVIQLISESSYIYVSKIVWFPKFHQLDLYSTDLNCPPRNKVQPQHWKYQFGNWRFAKMKKVFWVVFLNLDLLNVFCIFAWKLDVFLNVCLACLL